MGIDAGTGGTGPGEKAGPIVGGRICGGRGGGGGSILPVLLGRVVGGPDGGVRGNCGDSRDGWPTGGGVKVGGFPNRVLVGRDGVGMLNGGAGITGTAGGVAGFAVGVGDINGEGEDGALGGSVKVGGLVDGCGVPVGDGVVLD